jgi:TPR repeat protein
MKCVLCEMCEATRAALKKKESARFRAQSNSIEIMERETDAGAIHQAYSLLRTDPAESFRQYLTLAEQGSVWSMAIVGQMFQSGTGTARDLAQAEKWLHRAYQAGGSDYGMIWLGVLYEHSKQFAKALEVYRSGVERGFVPAMIRFAACYRNCPDWAQRRREVLTLLERGPAADDLFARQWLASAMLRGWFGPRLIPEGIRRLRGVARDMAKLLEDESMPRPGFFSRLAAQLWLVGATRHPVS